MRAKMSQFRQAARECLSSSLHQQLELLMGQMTQIQLTQHELPTGAPGAMWGDQLPKLTLPCLKVP